MSPGRFVTFAAILGASLAVARGLVRGHRSLEASPRPARSAAPKPSAPRTVSAASASRTTQAGSSVPTVGKGEPSRAAAAAEAPEDPLTLALCPAGMVLVDGTTCAVSVHRCVVPDPDDVLGCRRFAPAECRPGLALRFCIDRYEYPNTEGALPAAMITAKQARSACEEEGKRLCRDLEWTFACEGRDGLAFPYGDEYDPEACNTGRPAESVRPEELWEPRDISEAMSRVDGRARSGASRRCESPFGVFDLSGNVEEWVESSGGEGGSSLRGGDYSSTVSACRTVREMKDRAFRTVHTGFRCCRDPLVRVPRRPGEPVAPPARFD
jgi:hypothetical protein